MKNLDNIKQYRQEVILKFLVRMLEIDKNLADIDSSTMIESLSEESLIKISHFFDYLLQCSDSKIAKTSSEGRPCSSCCGKCDCKKI